MASFVLTSRKESPGLSCTLLLENKAQPREKNPQNIVSQVKPSRQCQSLATFELFQKWRKQSSGCSFNRDTGNQEIITDQSIHYLTIRTYPIATFE